VSFFTNKHLVVALLVAPVLAITSYIGVDFMLAESPHKAEVGQSYALTNKPNCRYSSGVCELVNGDMKIRVLPIVTQEGYVTLSLDSDVPLQQILMSSASTQNMQHKPVFGRSLGEHGKRWKVTLYHPEPEQPIRLAVVAQGVKYFSLVSSQFIY